MRSRRSDDSTSKITRSPCTAPLTFHDTGDPVCGVLALPPAPAPRIDIVNVKGLQFPPLGVPLVVPRQVPSRLWATAGAGAAAPITRQAKATEVVFTVAFRMQCGEGADTYGAHYASHAGSESV